MQDGKKTILTFIGYYLPGYKSGGPVRTISNMLNLLGDYYNFKIITRDRDALENKPYRNVNVNEWNEGPNCNIFYSNLKGSLRKVINETEFDTYYLNSFFDFHFSIKVILLLKLKLLPSKPVTLAPRGELSEGALSLKKLKKRTWLTLGKVLGLYKNITWHASSKYEAAEINREFGENVKIKIALDVPDYNLKKVERTHKKEKGKLKILFISSITPKKNLLYVIDVLNKVEGDFTLDIYGPVKDNKYWQKCLKHIGERIKDKITYKEIIPNEKIHEVYPNYDLFFFPTLGENFGHVIFESLFYGCPVLCSDLTPWDKLYEFNSGWNFDLNNIHIFIKTIEFLILLNSLEHGKYIIGCGCYMKALKNNKNIIIENKNLFN